MVNEYVLLNWTQGKLGNFVTLQRGYDLPEYRREPGSIPVVTSAGISGTHSTARVKAPGVVMGRYGTLGEIYFLDQDFWPHNTTLFVKDFHGNDPQFVAYFLRTLHYLAHSDKSSVPGLNRNDLHTIEVSFPPLSEQRAIAHILGSLDDKIDANRRMNATLEATARALFQSWFVDFDPVRAKAEGRQPEGMDAETAALFPDSFEDSVLGAIPVGWRVGTLSDLAQNPRRSVDPVDVPLETPYIGLEHMPKHSIALTAWGTALDVESQKFSFFEDEMLLGKLRPHFHKVGFAPFNGICSTDILVLTPYCSCFWGYLMMVLSDNKFIDYLSQLSTGTRMPRAKWSDVAQYRLVIPDSRVIEEYNSFVLPIAELIKRNIFDSRSMSLLRDFLLPLLITGELRVDEIEDVEALL